MPDDLPRPDHPQPCRIDFMDMHVGARLRRRRLQLRLEPQLLDVAIEEPSGTVERVERGDKRLGASQLYNLAVVLGVGVPYFFADDDDSDGDGRGMAEMPATDPKALSEAKRFARAVARISSPEIKHMITDLLKSLVPSRELPAIVPPAAGRPGDEPAADDAPSPRSACERASPCEKAPAGRTEAGPSREPWRRSDMPDAETKRAP
jgi:transcriptional regulator with XRE-family HTH domain